MYQQESVGRENERERERGGRERGRERERVRAHDQYFQEAWDILKDLRTHWEEGESEINSKGISQII